MTRLSLGAEQRNVSFRGGEGMALGCVGFLAS